ncbi:hypothetical protein LSH36_433g03015 [Paralvinella palmiformis]|uniref:SSD domain-containing protein n=1 Tax=Paralvinella palmiformis TaxID=53620 RepID=A0AAD9JCP8_9ANNE|nr:hypothetical protein LSH36_433g03015 [Paralvinella palmiformis]
MPRTSGNVAVQCTDAVPAGATVFPGIRNQGTPGGLNGDNYVARPQTCSGCRRTIPGSEFRTAETSFFDGSNVRNAAAAERSFVQRTTRQQARSGNRRGPPSAHLAHAAAAASSSHNRSADNSDLCTRPSWVDAYTAYKQIKKGKASGSKSALWLRWQLQKQLFNLGCFIQKHCGKVLFLGLLLLSLCCVGLKTASLETNVERLWVEEGGRLQTELDYTKKVLGEGSGSTYEIVIQTPSKGGSVLSAQSLLLHYKALRAATKISVELFDRTWDFTDLCFKPSFPSLDEGAIIDSILAALQPCTIITPLDCFWEGSKLLGPKTGIHLPGYPGQVFRWTNLNPQSLVRALSTLKTALPVSVESIQEILDRAGIGSAYQEKPCLNPEDTECPKTAPNAGSKQPLDIGRQLSGGCSGFASRYMHWEEELIVGGISRNRDGHITKAEAIQSMILLLGEKEVYEYVKYYKNDFSSIDWSLDKAGQVLQAWQRKFTKEINKIAMTSTTLNSSADNIYPFSSTSLIDLLQEFSEVSTVRVALGYALMIIPFLALGLGVDDMFLLIHTVAETGKKLEMPFPEQTGECLKRVGVSILLTSVSNACAFFIAAIIPIPALRAFCLQASVLPLSLLQYSQQISEYSQNSDRNRPRAAKAAILVLFNLATILFVFPAVISLDMIRRGQNKVDILCCISGSSSTAIDMGASRGRSPPPDYYDSTAPPAYSNLGLSLHQTILQTQPDGSNPVTVLAPPRYDNHEFHCVPGNAVCPVTSSLPPSTTSSRQCLTPEDTTSCQDHCSQAHRECCSWPLTRFARNVLAPLLQKTPTKIFTIIMFVISITLGIIGTIKVKDGLDITDVVPRETLEYNFLKAQSKYFGFYNFYAVTMKDFDYASDQQLLHDYYQAFQQVDKIIKRDDGTLPDFWLTMMRDWLLDMQAAFDEDWKRGHLTRNGWYKNATDDGIIGYMLMLQTGDSEKSIDMDRVFQGRLVDKDGIIYQDAFYNYLTAWAAIDALAYYSSDANLQPMPRDCLNVTDYVHNKVEMCTVFVYVLLTVARSQPLIFSQLAFYLHDLGDTAAVTSTVIEIRDICDKFATHGLPNYPSGIIFTFWEQYLNLRFYLMLALICILSGIFLVLSIVLMSPWTAFTVVLVLAMMVIELFGFMGLIGIKLSAVPAVILIVSVGIGVEFTVHICLGFLTSIGSRNKRMRMALEHMFAPVVHGAMTTFLGVVMLALSEFDFIVKYFFMVLTALIVIGLLNGLVLLPVLLSIMGPKAEVIPADRSDYLAPPSPELPPAPNPRERPVRSVSRRVYPRMPSDISLTTITEEPSSQAVSCLGTSEDQGNDYKSKKRKSTTTTVTDKMELESESEEDQSS